MIPLRKSFIQLLFSGALLNRWNDKVRPMPLMEMDKQAHKMIVAWLLIGLNSKNLSLKERLQLEKDVIEHALFDYLYRLIITDIKPPVFYKIRENLKDYAALTSWVLKQLEPIVRPLDEGFWQRLQAYHDQAPEPHHKASLCDKILKAAHLYASGWEFNCIKHLNHFDEETPAIEASFILGLQDLSDLIGVNDLLQDGTFSTLNTEELAKQNASKHPLDKRIFMPYTVATSENSAFDNSVSGSSALGRFAKSCGQLRFQIRWSGVPRIPETSVLGHMFFVGTLAYCCSLPLGFCQARCNNNFFTGLFHDLPELLTRDIISPVKKSTDQVANIIKKYEEEALEKSIFGPLIEAGHTEAVTRLQYYLGLLGNTDSEFEQTSYCNGVVRTYPDLDSLSEQANDDSMDPKDGYLVKACDNLAAYIEAYASIRNGVGATPLIEALARLRHQESERTNLGKLNFVTLFADFD